MEVNRIQSFLATINGVEFVNERRFDVVEYILHLIEYEFGIEVTAQFVEDLNELVGDLRLASEFTFADIEIILRNCVLVTIVFGVVSIGSSAIYVYDKVTTPSENSKTTDLYKITKENDYLTFTSKKPYNHLYRILKESVSE